MTSAAFIVFTLYMVPDPATTPLKPWRQAAFGFSVAMVYGIIQMLHLVFGLFFALITVCAIRGISLHLYYAFKSRGTSAPESVAKGECVNRAAQRDLAGESEDNHECQCVLVCNSFDRIRHVIRIMNPAIAIVGMACVYPDARSPGELWENVLAQRRAFRRRAAGTPAAGGLFVRRPARARCAPTALKPR